MKSLPRAIAGGAGAVAASALLVTSLAAPASAAVLSPAVIQPTAGATQINLVGFNDFHGRITTADLFASTVLQAQAPFGEANTIIMGNGDQVGASLFESAIQNDEPTIQALNALGVETYTEGNHEFDKGASDAINRVAAETNGPDLAANVTAADGSHPFKEYETFTVNGISVAVVGAVTADVPALVSPDGIAGYTFGDPVEAVNRVAAQLKDGNAANGEAQVIIASYHEGAPRAGSDAATFESNMSNPTFAHIVNDTAASVNAIYNAHSHMAYAYDAPVPGAAGRTRPIVQADAYGASIGQIVLTVDAQGAVTLGESSIIPQLKTVPAELAGDGRITQIQSIKADAVAKAKELGAEVIGTQTADATRAKVCAAGALTVAPDGTTSCSSVTTQDDRGNESNLGGIVANSMVDMVRATGRPVDAAFMNPGGLRTDLIAGADGQVTYQEAASVLPFANTLTYATLTGADIKAILEQQWQRNADGTVPGRSYLQLGLSDGISYTYDAALAEGSRITSVTIGGAPLDPAATYHVVAPNFLTAGGDNFRAFTGASAVEDTGLIDLESFVNWIKGKGTLPNDLARNGVQVTGPVGQSVEAGTSAEFHLSKFDLASLGAIQNRTVTATISGPGLAAPLEAGRADIATPNDVTLPVTIPAGLDDGAYSISFAFDNSDTVVTVPVAVTAQPVANTRLEGPNRYDTAVAVSQQYGIVGNPLVLVTGENYADALAAGPVAASLDASLLLTLPDQLPAAVATEIARLHPSQVYVIGSTASISDAVYTAAATYAGAPTERIAGADRIDTAAKLAERFFPGTQSALIATGWNFPDALSAAAAGTLSSQPVLLTTTDRLAPRAADVIRAGATNVSVLGSEASISAETATAAEALGATVTRYAGINRYETNVAVNDAFAPASAVDTIAVATGQNYPDALVASVVVDREHAGLVLTVGTCSVPKTVAYVNGLGTHSEVVLGSAASVADGWSKAC